MTSNADHVPSSIHLLGYTLPQSLIQIVMDLLQTEVDEEKLCDIKKKVTQRRKQSHLAMPSCCFSSDSMFLKEVKNCRYILIDPKELYGWTNDQCIFACIVQNNTVQSYPWLPLHQLYDSLRQWTSIVTSLYPVDEKKKVEDDLMSNGLEKFDYFSMQSIFADNATWVLSTDQKKAFRALWVAQCKTHSSPLEYNDQFLYEQQKDTVIRVATPPPSPHSTERKTDYGIKLPLQECSTFVQFSRWVSHVLRTYHLPEEIYNILETHQSTEDWSILCRLPFFFLWMVFSCKASPCVNPRKTQQDLEEVMYVLSVVIKEKQNTTTHEEALKDISRYRTKKRLDEFEAKSHPITHAMTKVQCKNILKGEEKSSRPCFYSNYASVFSEYKMNCSEGSKKSFLSLYHSQFQLLDYFDKKHVFLIVYDFNADATKQNTDSSRGWTIYNYELLIVYYSGSTCRFIQNRVLFHWDRETNVYKTWIVHHPSLECSSEEQKRLHLRDRSSFLLQAIENVSFLLFLREIFPFEANITPESFVWTIEKKTLQ